MNRKDVEALRFKMDYYKCLRKRLEYESKPATDEEGKQERRIFFRDLNDVDTSDIKGVNNNAQTNKLKAFYDVKKYTDDVDVLEYMCDDDRLGCVKSNTRRKTEEMLETAMNEALEEDDKIEYDVRITDDTTRLAYLSNNIDEFTDDNQKMYEYDLY